MSQVPFLCINPNHSTLKKSEKKTSVVVLVKNKKQVPVLFVNQLGKKNEKN